MNYTRTINDGAPAVLTHTYRVSGSDAAIAAASQISGPVLTVNTPTEGQVTSNPSLQVSGTVTDEGDVKSLTVNNLPTTVTPDGGFTQTVALNEGANTITVVATDTAGKSATVTRKVTSTSKSSSCTVPNVAGKAVAAAQTAIEAAGCTLGTQSLATSKTVANGSVVSQSQAAGRKVSAFYPVDLVVSAGKPALVTLGSGTVKLKSRTLSVQLRCPAGSSKVCSGTAKIRTTSGKGSTLGTRAFQTPAGQKRKVTFVLSKAAARRIHKAGRVKADVFVVSRDIDGKAQSTKLKLTIVG